MSSDTGILAPAVVKKRARLEAILRELGSVAVAFSGGVDSTLLLAEARRVLGDDAIALTARGDAYPASDTEEAAGTARHLGARQIVVETCEMDDPHFTDNPRDRCYYCKRELLEEFTELARQEGFEHVLDGANADDLDDYRPGLRASKEMAVRSPLAEAGLTKDDIRAISREMGLPTWDQPARPCLASRFPYGTEITRERLAAVAEAEAFLRDEGFTECRVRYHGEVARIELPAGDLECALAPRVRGRIVAAVKRAGFTYVALDLEGFRSGSMNEVL